MQPLHAATTPRCPLSSSSSRQENGTRRGRPGPSCPTACWRLGSGATAPSSRSAEASWATSPGSLPPAQLAAGMAEALKHGVIADAAYFAFLEEERHTVAAKDPGALERVVRRSVEIKAAVVAADEREAGRRAILNFGHTVGHAIEATAQFTVLHGEAVAMGMACEARLAEALGIAERGTADRIRGALERYGLPLDPPDSTAGDDLIAAMQLDKKARGGKVRFALPRAVGAMHGDVQSGWTVAAPTELVRQILSGPG